MLMMEVEEQTTDHNISTVPMSGLGKPVRDRSSTDAGKQERWSAGCFTPSATTGLPVTSRNDWMTTDKILVTLERQMTPETVWSRGNKGCIPKCSSYEKTPTNKLQTLTMKDTLRVYRAGGRMIDSHKWLKVTVT